MCGYRRPNPFPIRLIALLFTLWTFADLSSTSAEEQSGVDKKTSRNRPNIIFILADDK